MKVIDTYYRNETTKAWDRISRRITPDFEYSPNAVFDAAEDANTIEGNYAIVVSTIPNELISTIETAD